MLQETVGSIKGSGKSFQFSESMSLSKVDIRQNNNKTELQNHSVLSLGPAA